MVLSVISACTTAKPKVDLILYNAKIYTVDKDFSVTDCVVIDSGKIVETGTKEKLLAKYKESLSKQMQEATDERMKEWYNRQIQALDESSGDALDARLENYRRYENMRKLSEIARKYKIPRSEFRNYGMQVYGGYTPGEKGGEN